MLVCVRARERERGRESLYNCSEWLVIQVGLEWRGRLVMQPKLEMSLCHCGESVCVCYVSVLWLITRISPLYCSTDPLWSAPPNTHTDPHSPLSSPFPSPPFICLFSSFLCFCLSQLSHLHITRLCLSRPSLSPSHPHLFVLQVCVSAVCLHLLAPTLKYMCLYQTVRVCVYPWVAFWMFVTVWGCERVRTRAIREQYMMYSLKVLNILMHMAANLRKHPAIYNSHTHTQTHNLYRKQGVFWPQFKLVL